MGRGNGQRMGTRENDLVFTIIHMLENAPADVNAEALRSFGNVLANFTLKEQEEVRSKSPKHAFLCEQAKLVILQDKREMIRSAISIEPESARQLKKLVRSDPTLVLEGILELIDQSVTN